MPNKILRYIIIILIFLSNFSVNQVSAETQLDFELIPMHYGLLNEEPLTKGENTGITSFILDNSADKGATEFLLAVSNYSLHPSELLVYQGISGSYYIAQVRSVTGNSVLLMRPLEENVNAGSNLWNFYVNDSHPNTFGFYALADYALEQLKGENLSNKTHAFIGDSWFDNDKMVPRLASKLNASSIINKGSGGRTTIDVLNAFDTDLPPTMSVKPDYVWIILGTNDWWDEITRETYIDNLKQIIQKVNDLGAKAIVFTSSVAPLVYDSNNVSSSKYYDLSNHYADDLIALNKAKKKISVIEKGDGLVIEYSSDKAISNNAHYQFFIDSDDSQNTGYQLSSHWNNAGADYLIQNDNLYESLSSGWDWGNIKQVELLANNKILVSKNNLGLSNNTSNIAMQVGVVIYSNDWNTVEDYYPKTGQMQKIIMSTSATPIKANLDTVTISQGDSITIDVLSNDVGSGIRINNHATPANGSLYLANNKLVYTPNMAYFGVENFWYEIIDSSGQTSWGVVKVTVEKNVILKANVDTATVGSGNSVTIDVLANDTGSGLTIGWYDEADNGTVSISHNQVVYTSNSGFTGLDKFWYELVDSSGNTTWGEIKVTVENTSAALTANNDIATVKASKTVLIDVLNNDNGNNIELMDVDDAWTGSIIINGSKLEYKSDGSYIGEIVIWYGISDANGDTDWATVTINITL